MSYEMVIGLEIHCELNTKTKCFCDCKNERINDVNTNVCPVCLGLPGAIPTINREAVRYAILAGLGFNCEINNLAIMERKNYFYPDLSKGYQISQLVKPFCINGHIDYGVNENKKTLRINNIHLEEDAGKNIHDEITRKTFVDYNRAGVPLIEIVTEPDLRSAEDTIKALNSMMEILVYLGVSECRMEKGEFRVDVNLSVREQGAKEYGTRTEMKNLNSFKAIERAINFEYERQIALIENGQKIVQETRKWDDNRGENISLRSKEEANDYKYFPEPDLLPINVTNEYIEKVRKSLPVLPNELRNLFLNEYGLPEFDTNIILGDKNIAKYFLNASKLYDKPKVISNWILSDVLRKIKDNLDEEDGIIINENTLIEIIKLVDEKVLSTTAGKQVFDYMWDNNLNGNTTEIAKELGLIQNNDKDAIREVVEAVLNENETAVNDYKNGNEKVIAFLVGKVMKASKGKANPTLVNQLIKEILA